MSAEPQADRDRLELLADEFIQRLREGQYPPISEYVRRYPDLADDIRDLFPTIASMEQLKLHKQSAQEGGATLGGTRLERLGDFHIVREIGRGGMGVVFEAEQESLGRRVAIKVLPRQALLAPEQLKRFEREARIAAGLHHTNIVSVFGVGQQEGFHYYVMQFISGVGLDRIIARLARAAGRPAETVATETFRLGDTADEGALRLEAIVSEFFRTTEAGPPPTSPATQPTARPRPPVPPTPALPMTVDMRLPTASIVPPPVQRRPATEGAGRLAPFAVGPLRAGENYWECVARIGFQVALALHYAHTQGTLHCDVKPANLLVDAQGIVWITDFGVAKAMLAERITHTGDLTGTIHYMAPERFRGQTDPRSDVYSLGLTLYELLTLRPAFDAAERQSLIRRVMEGGTPPPRKIDPRIPRDLETIVVKAVAREPQDRYASAQAMADDLQRYLEDRPLLARRATPGERLRRWCRRNPTVAGLTAAVALLMLTVTAITTAGYVHIRQTNVRIEQALAGEKDANARVREALQREKTASGRLTQALDGETQSNNRAQQALAGEREANNRVKLALQRETDARAQSEATAKLARDVLDRVYAQFAANRSGAPSELKVEGTQGTDIQVALQPTVSKETAAQLENLLTFYNRLAQQTGDSRELREEAAKANQQVGVIHARLGQYDQAQSAFARALTAYDQLQVQDPQSDSPAIEMGNTLNEQGNLERGQIQLYDAATKYRQALKVLQPLAAHSKQPEARYQLARTYYALGSLMRQGLGPAGAPADHGPPPEGGFGSPFPPGRHGGPRNAENGPPGKPPPDWPRDDRGPPDQSPRGSGGMSAHARSTSHGRPKEPSRPVDRGAAQDRSPSKPERPPGPRSVINREDELAYLRKAIDILQQLIQEQPAVGKYRQLLACCYRDLPGSEPGKTGDTADLRHAVQILEQLVKDHPGQSDYRADLTEAYAELGVRLSAADSAAADGYMRQATQLADALVAEYPLDSAYTVRQVQVLERLAESQQRSQRWEKAEATLRKAVGLQAALRQRFPETTSHELWLVILQDELARVLQQRRQLTEARSLLDDSIRIVLAIMKERPELPQLRPLAVESYHGLAAVLHDMGEEKLSTEARARSRELRPPRAPEPPSQ